MKKFFKSAAFKMVLGILLITCGVVLYSVSRPSDNIFLNALNTAVVPAQKFVCYISDLASNFAHQFEEKEHLKDENENLKSQIAQLRDIKIDYENLKRENARFKKYYGIKDSDKNLKFVSAAVIGRDATDIFGDFIIDQGSNAGVSLNDAVITENGFVGRVCQVSANSARVKTILSPDAKIGVVDSTTGDSGVISGSAELASQNLTRMMFVPAHGEMKTDDIIITSGISGMYPKDLKLGKFKTMEYDSYESAYYALIEPFEKIKRVSHVFVVTDFSGKGLMAVLNSSKT